MTTAIPEPFLRVLANPHARLLLLLLADQRKPIRYSEARRQLDLRPPEFQRALVLLEDSGLVLTRAPAENPRAPREKRRQVVFLEATHLGRFLGSYWPTMNREFEKMAKATDLERVLALMES